MFIWRCCRSAVAVRVNLRQRRVEVEAECPMCGSYDETEAHLFFRCEVARIFWFASPLQLDVDGVVGEDFLSCWEYLVQKYGQVDRMAEILQVVAFGLWRIWKGRNAVVFERQPVIPMDLVQSLLRQLTVYREAHESTQVHRCKLPRPAKSTRTHRRNWLPPPSGSVKAKCDAAWEQQTGRGGVGWVIRSGGVVRAGCRGLKWCGSALVAEAEAIRDVLGVCLQAGLLCLEVESDSQEVIRMIRGECLGAAAIACILFYVHEFVRRFQQVVFRHTPRLCNHAAHEVAAFFLRDGGSFVWDQSGPAWLHRLLTIDDFAV